MNGSVKMFLMHNAYRQVGALLLLVVSMGLVFVAQATTLMADGKGLYAPCVVCHQPNAWGSPDGSIPNLAGQQERYLEKQLSSFRYGARGGTAMQLVSAHSTFSDTQNVIALADYLSTLDANPKSVKGPGEHLRVGQEIYTHICASCHGFDGQGERRGLVPSVAGQHYPYLRRQIEEATLLHRALASSEMATVLRHMRAQEKDALADYISRLNKSETLLDSNPSDGARKMHGPNPP